MGKIYSLCLGSIVDVTPKWKTTSNPPKSWPYTYGYYNRYKLWKSKQPPEPEAVIFCNKCGKKYGRERLIKRTTKALGVWPHSVNQCYKKIYNNNQQEHKENNMLINQKNLILNNGIPSEILIRNNVELPCPERGNTYSKYGFISTLEVGESFEVNGDTPDFRAKSLAPAAYAIAKHVRTTTRNKKFTIACRTIHGTCKEPTVVGCWRTA